MNSLIEQWEKEEQALFEGWDFDYLKDRYEEYDPPWDYVKMAQEEIEEANSVLDMGTGGGEIFAEILTHRRPKKAIALESYKPNVAVAQKRLKKFKVKVIYTDEIKRLPFNDNEFDLVLNRHSGFTVEELARIIRPGGKFLTQQVENPHDAHSLLKIFKVKDKWPENNLPTIAEKLNKHGFRLLLTEVWDGLTVFKDVGALVYYLKAIPWIVDDFSVEKYKDLLKKLNKKAEKAGQLEFSSKRFLILAVKK